MSHITSRQAIAFVDSPALADGGIYTHAASTASNNRQVYTSGQIALRKNGSYPDTFEGQVEQSMSNLAAALAAAGASPRDIVKLNFYIVDWDMASRGQSLVEACLTFLTTEYGVTYRPLTTMVPVTQLAMPEAKFEIEAIASVSSASEPWLSPASKTSKLVTLPPVQTDVVVVGGGFSGLAAAHKLHEAGLRVIVLEARDRIGGRSWTKSLDSGPGTIELGATWINKTTQPAVYALTQKFGLKTAEQYTQGDTINQLQDGVILRGNGLADLLGQEFFELVDVVTKASDKLSTYSAYPEAEDMVFSKWAVSKGFTSEKSRQLIDHICRAMVGRDANQVGAHYMLDYIKSGKGIISLSTEDEHGAQYLKVKPGTSAIAHALADSLPAGSMLVKSAVVSVVQDGNEDFPCLVATDKGLDIRARKVIMANPTNTYDAIDFTPPLPRAKRCLVSQTMPGIYAKVVLVYKQPWWREAGLNGKFESFRGPICFSWDSSSDTQYSVALFVAGSRAASWHSLSQLKREEAIIEHLAELVGPELEKQARDILEIHQAEWTKMEHLGGAPTSSMGPHMLRQLGGALHASFGNIHTAGGETAYEWKGYLEGAVTSGQRAAGEIIKDLKLKSRL